jgi:eukaryotic-like serine/threonine-protein kinase
MDSEVESESNMGPYWLEHRLGGGGMAEVFLARQQLGAGAERRCVVKRLWPEMGNDPDQVEMFDDEARLAARLAHPNLVPIYDFGESDGTHYISMEYVPGRTLAAILQEHAARGAFVSFPVAARIVSQVADALDYAHQARDADGRPLQVVHRDISPQNILVSTSGTVKLIDFGIAKSKADRLQTRVGYIKGKLSYMSPEQASARPLDARSDLFSLGLVLFELLTNAKPFPPQDDISLMLEAVRQAKVEPLGKFREGIPEPLKDIVTQALQSERALRFQRAADMSFELERFILRHGAVVSPGYVAKLAGVDRFPEPVRVREPMPEVPIEKEETARFALPPEPTLVLATEALHGTDPVAPALVAEAAPALDAKPA